MTDNSTQMPSSSATTDTRTLAIVCYVLYFTALASGITALVGVIIAYVKKNDARGSIYESHFDNLISVFWVALVGCIVGIATVWVLGLGVLVLIGVFVWYLYRTIKGFIALMDNKPYV